ncbi:MAG: phosphatidylserine decarboxylase [Proteobacteria bacterium]|nr:phosphatidylserine decarboxylase [Pseudomonadota bacterium]
MLENIKDFIPAIHKEGHIFVIIFFFVTGFFFLLSSKLGYVGLILTMCCALFFRDPERVTIVDSSALISPADGRVVSITKVQPPSELGMSSADDVTKISIFLSVLDVHVNRMPASGTIQKLHYHPGTFVNASLDKASENNERQLILLKTDNDEEIGVVQIAGLIARRIVCDLQQGESVKAGERFGIIRFGSRVDLYIPASYKIEVLKGQYMIGGETVMARSAANKKKARNT